MLMSGLICRRAATLPRCGSCRRQNGRLASRFRKIGASQIMGGYGSGRRGGGPTVESEFAFRIDIDALRRDGLIRLGVRGGCVIRFSHPCRDLDMECETHIGGPWDD